MTDDTAPEPIPEHHHDWHDWLGSYMVVKYGLRDWDDAQHLLYWLSDEDLRVRFAVWLAEQRGELDP